jgi:hypothetical protein
VTEDQNAPLVRDDAPTGNDAVDRVLDSLDALADSPVAEHVAVFEAAHDQLRGALADAGNSQPAQG